MVREVDWVEKVLKVFCIKVYIDMVKDIAMDMSRFFNDLPEANFLKGFGWVT